MSNSVEPAPGTLWDDEYHIRFCDTGQIVVSKTSIEDFGGLIELDNHYCPELEVVLMTPVWQEFAEEELAGVMKLIGTRALYDPKYLEAIQANINFYRGKDLTNL